ncbi:MAG: FumA C-terminus/TtdB family hydratase beta subunit [Candidatus Omnitrophota bacterium]
MSVKKIRTPLDQKTILALNAGDEVLLSGTIYTARDQAHLRLSEMISKGEKLPIDPENKIFYYCGPAPSGGNIIGSCGPTTSGRMDPFTKELLILGLKGMIGKGLRSPEIKKAIKENKAVYFLAPGGAGAYLSKKVKACELIGFEDLGPEAIYKLEVEDFPLIVGIDSKGRDLYERFGETIDYRG